MKKLVLAALTALITTITFSQVGFGLKAGLNLSKPEGFIHQNEFIVTEHFGAFAKIDINKSVFLRPELLYNVKGYKFPALGMYDKGTLSFSYISMPLFVGSRQIEKVSILLGPEVGYLLNAKYRFPDSAASHPEYFNKIDFAANIGAGYTINKKISVELRYSHGFKTLIDVVYTDQFGNETGKGKIGAHRVFQLSLSYQFKND